MKAFFLAGLLFVGGVSTFTQTQAFEVRVDEWNASPSEVSRKYHREYKKQIMRYWNPPKNAKGAFVKVKFNINNDGSVKKARVETINDELRISMQSAINSAAPYPLPVNKDQRRLTRNFVSTFFVR